MIEEKQAGCDAGRLERSGLMVAREDSGILNELFAVSIPRLLRAAEYILRNHHDSEDALQDGLLSALWHLDQFRGDSEFSTWLNAIVRNAALVQMRRRRSRPTISIDDEDSGERVDFSVLDPKLHSISNPEREYAQAEISFLLREELKHLPASYQLVIRLCDLEGLSGKEAAHRLGLTVSALKAQHHRARQAIRESMGSRIARKTK